MSKKDKILRKLKKMNAEFTAKLSKKKEAVPEKETESAVKSKDGIKYSVVSGSKTSYIKIAGFEANVEVITVPEKIDGLKVEVLQKEAVKGNKTIKEVVLPNTIRIIGSGAFYGCENLKFIEMPADVETINESTFENCTSLETAILPYSVKKIGKNAFKNCSSLTDTFHYVKTGISATMELDKSLKEDNLPSGLKIISPSAFEGCAKLQRVYLPYGIRSVNKAVFKGCKNLKEVYFHDSFKKIDSEAFAGCTSLTSVKLPKSIESVEKTAFEATTGVAVYAGTAEAVTKNIANVAKIIEFTDIQADSAMRPNGDSEFKTFYNEELLSEALEQYELRTPVHEVAPRNEKDSKIIDSRFEYRDGKYYSKGETTNSAKIIMTGDLMCRPSQIKTGLVDGEYNFDAGFDDVRAILSDSDLTIGNMESMISKSCPYSSEAYYVDDRVNLNAPAAFLSSVRAAGFDVVINAQNHAYDSGAKGVYETLDALNKYQLMHTGIFASNTEKRYLLIDVNGINVAVVAYFDQARQRMKRLNFTTEGVNTLFNNYDENQIREDIRQAREEGAEFVIAYCHWGREYTKEITEKQENLAKMVANAGADYLFGSHSHCIQPYSVITTDDGRTVPVLYSGGNFISDMNIKMPMVRDTLITELELSRNAEGKVEIKAEKYHPCVIKDVKGLRGRVRTIPVAAKIKDADTEARITYEEDIMRICNVVGNVERFKPVVDDEDNPLVQLGLMEARQENNKYEVGRLPIAKLASGDAEDSKNEYEFIEAENMYKRAANESEMEARLICTGQIRYDGVLEQDAECFGKYEFSKGFKTVSNCFQGVDFVIGNMTSMVSEEYPSMERFKNNADVKEFYCNARPEFIDTLKAAGFTGLAMANPYNLCTNVDGIYETQEALEKRNLICSGLGTRKDPVVEINGIKIAFLSYATDCINNANIISAEGSNLLLNEYNKQEFEKSVAKVKAAGAEFIMVYINCGIGKNKFDLAQRKEIAEELAEAGADYIICTTPGVVSKYYRYETEDKRQVPIATSLGDFITGATNKESILSAMLKVTVRKSFDGKVEVSDNFIPLKIFKEHKGVQNAIMPALYYFNKGYDVKNYAKVKSTLTSKLGSDLPINEERAVKMKMHYKDNFTIEELYKILGAKPSAEDLKKFGKNYKKPVSCLVSRKPDLKKGCVAVLDGFDGGYQRAKIKVTEKDAVQAGASLIIANKKYTKLPCIVVERPVETVFTELAGMIRDKYDPITVAITGSVGKTTTKDLMSRAFANHYREFHIEGNNNTIYTIRQVLQKLDASDEAYIQEVHGGSINAAKNVSNLIKPDIAIITSIGQAHLGQMGSMENVIQGKMDIAAGLKENGVLVINDDNEHLHAQKPDVRTIRYSSFNPECDYYAQNVVVKEEEIFFQIVSKGTVDEPGVFDAKLNIQGEHNVQNAVGVFAAARQANIPPHKIIAGLASYRTEGVRQNIINVGGCKLLVDVYSSNPVSLISAMKTLQGLPVENDGRRIAVVGELPDQGDESIDVHYQVGKDIAEFDFDVMLCIGPDSEYIAKAVKEAGKTAYFFEERDTFNEILAEMVKPGDVVLFKASTRYASMKDVTLLPVFGDIS